MKIGLIGGSGLDKADFIENRRPFAAETPYGRPSSALVSGTVEKVPVVFLARHGPRHTITPSRVNNRANIAALARAGCTHIVATTACGSLRGKIGRGEIVIPDQFIDFTRRRPVTFFETLEPGPDKPGHVGMADPFDGSMREAFIKAAGRARLPVHPAGTIITIEGPRFSTRAESRMFRAWGADLVNMTTAPEAILANEAAIPYLAVALATDYDCWKTDEPPVSFEGVLALFAENLPRLTGLVRAGIGQMAGPNNSPGAGKSRRPGQRKKE